MGSKTINKTDTLPTPAGAGGRIAGFGVALENDPIADNTGSAFDRDLVDALRTDQISKARTLVANAEAILAAHAATRDAREAQGADVSRADVAAAKAKIAMATGDSIAARAILVQAIEQAPDVSALRTLMAEVMLASGRATDVRPVLHHLGREPHLHEDAQSPAHKNA